MYALIILGAAVVILAGWAGAQSWYSWKVRRAQSFIAQNRTEIPGVRCTCISEDSWNDLPLSLRVWWQKEIIKEKGR